MLGVLTSLQSEAINYNVYLRREKLLQHIPHTNAAGHGLNAWYSMVWRRYNRSSFRKLSTLTQNCRVEQWILCLKALVWDCMYDVGVVSGLTVKAELPRGKGCCSPSTRTSALTRFVVPWSVTFGLIWWARKKNTADLDLQKTTQQFLTSCNSLGLRERLAHVWFSWILTPRASCL